MEKITLDLIKLSDNSVHKAELSIIGRGGTKSPDTWIWILSNGHRIVPYAFVKLWKPLNSLQLLNVFCKIMYTKELITDLIYAENPLLKAIKSKPNFSGQYIPVPIRK